MLTTFPIAMIFVVLRVPIIQVVFERGAFHHRTTIAVANVLLLLLGAFLLSGIGNVTGKVFYISQKTKLRATLGCIYILAYLALSYFLTKYFFYKGLAAASSLYFTLGFVVNMLFSRRIMKGVNGKHLLDGLTKITLSCLIGCIAIYFCFTSILLEQNLIIRASIASMLGVLTYFLLIIWIFKVDEAVSLIEKLARFLKLKRVKYELFKYL